jgi:prevent-host-death family protein
VYTIRSLRANLRAAIAGVRATGVPAVIAERGERPVAVLVDYATWVAQQGGTSVAAPAAEITRQIVAARQATSEREPRPAAARAVPVQQDATVGTTGWGSQSTPRGPEKGEQAAIPAGWRAAASGWGG